MCSSLTVTNGEVTYSQRNLTVDTIAIYSCTEGYALVGDSQRVCVDDDQLDTMGQWNGSAPLCEGELLECMSWHIANVHYILFCFTAVGCPALEELGNGQIIYSVDSLTDFSLDTIATFICNESFSLDGNSTRTCMDDDQADTIGVWSGEMPSCIGVNSRPIILKH